MSWRRVAKALQALVAHVLLFSFTISLALKLDHVIRHSWWLVFSFSFSSLIIHALSFWLPNLETVEMNQRVTAKF